MQKEKKPAGIPAGFLSFPLLCILSDGLWPPGQVEEEGATAQVIAVTDRHVVGRQDFGTVHEWRVCIEDVTDTGAQSPGVAIIVEGRGMQKVFITKANVTAEHVTLSGT